MPEYIIKLTSISRKPFKKQKQKKKGGKNNEENIYVIFLWGLTTLRGVYNI